MKRTDLAKNEGLKIAGRIKPFGNSGKPGAVASVVDRREQRRQDQALGLVPFACKLNVDLVAQLRELSLARNTDLNQLVADLLTKGLAQP